MLLAVLAAGCGGDKEAETTGGGAASAGDAAACTPTRADVLGPFHEPGAPVRRSVGTGYGLSGRVRSAEDCRPIDDAEIEFWLVNPEGQYDDAHRARLPVGEGGRYRFESNKPEAYSSRPPHIHIRVTAPGHPPFVTQHYPGEEDRATMDLVIPAGS